MTRPLIDIIQDDVDGREIWDVYLRVGEDKSERIFTSCDPVAVEDKRRMLEAFAEEAKKGS